MSLDNSNNSNETKEIIHVKRICFDPILYFEKIEVNAKTPSKVSNEAAGFDMYSVEDVLISPFDTIKVRTGIKLNIPKCHYGRLAPTSGN